MNPLFNVINKCAFAKIVQMAVTRKLSKIKLFIETICTLLKANEGKFGQSDNVEIRRKRRWV